MKQSAQIIA